MTWQKQRAKFLQQSCNQISELVLSGVQIGRAIKRVAREFNQRELGSGRRLNLSEKTLQRFWYSWSASGRNPAIFALKYSANDHQIVDPLLLRLLIERTFQTGAPLSEVVENLKRAGVKVSLDEIRRAFPKGDLRKFERSLRQLTGHRLKLEEDFIAAGAKWRRALLKQRTQTLRKILAQDAALERRILGHRDQLQRKFLQADARVVRRREQLQRKFVTAANQTV